MRRRRPRLCFLSHSHHDRRFAQRLESTLNSHGVPVWYSPTQIRGSQQWLDEIGKALKRCDWFIIVLSPQAVKSIWVKRELDYAIRHRRFNERIIPIKYRDCQHTKLSWTLDGIQTVDFTKEREAGFVELLRIWGIEYKT